MAPNEVVIIIPARYGSTRFPGKPLAGINGKTMIERVYEQAKKAVEDVFVATDDSRIFDHVDNFGNVLMTDTSHSTGTERCIEAYNLLPKKYRYIINLQGDEPFIDPDQIISLIEKLDGKVEIASQKRLIGDDEEASDPNIVKVVCGKNDRALYFSRSPIPYSRDKMHEAESFVHVGIYAFRDDILSRLGKLKPGKLELTESLEQLRWLEEGFDIRVYQTKYFSRGIDIPSDLKT